MPWRNSVDPLYGTLLPQLCGAHCSILNKNDITDIVLTINTFSLWRHKEKNSHNSLYQKEREFLLCSWFVFVSWLWNSWLILFLFLACLLGNSEPHLWLLFGEYMAYILCMKLISCFSILIFCSLSIKFSTQLPLPVFIYLLYHIEGFFVIILFGTRQGGNTF